MSSLTDQDWEFMKGNNVALGAIHPGFRVPAAYLDWFLSFQAFLPCDINEVEKNPMYAAWFLRQGVGDHHSVVLEQISSSDVMWNIDRIKLAEMVGAALIVGPYDIDDRKRTINETLKLASYKSDMFDVLGVVESKSIDEMVDTFRRYLDSDIQMVGFPNTISRLSLLRKLADLHLLEARDNYNLMGFKDFDELKMLGSFGKWTWLLHTDLPIKAAILEKQITDKVKGSDVAADTAPLFHQGFKISDRQLYAATLNTVRFQTFLPNDSEQDDDDDCSEE